MSHGYNGKYMTRAEIDELEHTFDSDECLKFVKSLLDSLDNDEAFGVCRYYLHNGYETLSEKQKKVFKIALQQNLLKCSRCEDFYWIEAEFVIDNGLCSYCQQSWDNS